METSAVKTKSPDKSWLVKRTQTSKQEAAFAEQWIDECKPRRWLNYGHGLVQDLFLERGLGVIDPLKVVAVLTNRERMIAATVIQWLGTNCGRYFLDEALGKCGYKIIKVKAAKEGE